MDTLNPSPSPSPELAELREQQRLLQILLIITLAGLIVFGGAVAAFIEKQRRIVRQNLAEQQTAVQRLISDFQRGSEPLIRNFSSALVQFASTNQDFRPILDKYRPVLSNYIGAPLPAIRPAAGKTN